MLVSLWDLSKPNSSISGLKRYSDELYKYCNLQEDIETVRYGSTNSAINTFLGYSSGDITHLTNQQLAFVGYLKRVKNGVVTVHDIIPHHWYSIKRSIRDKWLPNEFLLSKLDMYIVDSEYTKTDLVTHFKVPDEKIKVVYLGVDHSVFYQMDRKKCRELFGMKDDEIYLLSVSSGEPWKNTKILGELPYNVLDIGYGRGELGGIGDDRLACLYNACDAFVAPSVAEGFGLPIVEAMSCGCPVIASNVTALPEVVGDGGVTVNPYEPAEWISAIDSVLDSRYIWSRRAIERSSCFSWDKCGKETVDVYREMVR
jgi:glycosyltransferase involved in cell wall biosynthesis